MTIFKLLTKDQMDFTSEGVVTVIVASLIGALISYYGLRNTKKADKAEADKLNEIQETLKGIATDLQAIGITVGIGDEKHKMHEARFKKLETKVDAISDDILTALLNLAKK